MNLAALVLLASTFLPVSDVELSRRAAVIFVGTTHDSRAIRTPDGLIYTETAFTIEQLLKGPLPRGARITLRDLGGELPDGHGLAIEGRATYQTGHRYLIHASRRRDGTFTTAEMRLGRRELPRPGVRPEWAQWSATELYRWNNGATAAWLLSETPNNIAGGGYSEARTALAEWDAEPNSDINYSDGGFGPVTGTYTNLTINLASEDTCGALGPFCPAQGQGGVIGCGGPFYEPAASCEDWRGECYRIITGGFVNIRQLSGPSCLDSNTFAAAVTHELGHTLGFGHADTGATSTHDICRGDENNAQMRSWVQSRGPSLGTDDTDAARWVYGDGQTGICGTPTPTPTMTPTPTYTPTPTPTKRGKGHH